MDINITAKIEKVEGEFENGDIIAVRDFDGYFLGYGFINTNSKIRIRVMSRFEDTIIDEEFIYQRLRSAWNYRRDVLAEGDTSSCRVVFGEADFLPGITIDKYEDVLVIESLALGLDRLKTVIAEMILRVFREDGISIRGIYERSDAKERKKEGLPVHKGFIGKEFETDIEITENGVKYLVDVVNGQKTGFFLDQKYNRLAMQRICDGLVRRCISEGRKTLRVLDCFTHMGTFALNCGLAMNNVLNSQTSDNAPDNTLNNTLNNTRNNTLNIEVTGLDISEYAVMQASNNATRNGLSHMVHFRAANVLDELPKLYEKGEKYDVLILDPPAFTKSREATKNAIKGYREINMKGLRLVKDGGYFATCSCSHFMTQELFTEVIGQAARAVHKRLSQVEFRTQAPDHPILWAAGETYYLKFYIFRVCEEK